MTSNVPAETQQTPLELCTNIQRLFVEGRLNGLPPKEAGRFAGMSEQSLSTEAYKMDKHPKVRAAIEYVLTSGQDLEVTKNYVIEGFKDAVRAAKDSTELTNAYRELGKMLGHYAPEVRVELTADATMDDVRQMTDKELMGMETNPGEHPELEKAIEGEFTEIVDACKSLDEEANEREEDIA